MWKGTALYTPPLNDPSARRGEISFGRSVKDMRKWTQNDPENSLTYVNDPP